MHLLRGRNVNTNKAKTGIKGLDDILNGGYLKINQPFSKAALVQEKQYLPFFYA